jgi:recombination protein RecA
MFNEGISKHGDILDIATELGVIEKRGSFYRYRDEMIGQGREAAKQFLRENVKLAMEIENIVREEYGLPAIYDVDGG